jgi:hypothetical protein
MKILWFLILVLMVGMTGFMALETPTFLRRGLQSVRLGYETPLMAYLHWVIWPWVKFLIYPAAIYASYRRWAKKKQDSYNQPVRSMGEINIRTALLKIVPSLALGLVTGSLLVFYNSRNLTETLVISLFMLSMWH